MRIALLVSSFPKLSESFIVNKFIGLSNQGHDVYIICNQSKASEWKNFPSLRPELKSKIRLNWTVHPRWIVMFLWLPLFLKTWLIAPTTTWKYLKFGWLLGKFNIIRQFYLDAHLIAVNPDIIHIEFGALAPNRIHIRDLLDCKIVVSFRGYDINYAGLEQPEFYAEVWKKADGIHLLGEDLWNRAKRRGCPPDKFHALIPPAIDTTYFVPSPSSQPRQDNQVLRIVSVGRLEWKKGYEYALQAIREMVFKGYSIEYRIIGDGNYLESLTFCRFQLGLEDNVKFIGAISHKDLVHYLIWADIFLHSAVSEGFCNAVIEAQAMQIPVVTSDADGLSENVKHGITGFVVPRRDPQALADKLMVLAEDTELRTRMGQAGRDRILSKFTLSDQILAFENFYRHLP